MKKYLFMALAFCATLMTAVSFTSCGDDESIATYATVADFKGSWKSQTKQDVGYIYMYFNDTDKTFYQYYFNSKTGSPVGDIRGTYAVEDGYLKLTTSSSGVVTAKIVAMTSKNYMKIKTSTVTLAFDHELNATLSEDQIKALFE